MSDDFVNIEVNGKPCKAKKGEVIIKATDRLGPDAYVPRFCYHDKLAIAANCRMCLVDVEKAPKPLPACATPVTEGMKIFTKSPRAIGAQRATMEFLLINHPLDCPICDQGGECELQDLAVGFGRDISRFNERKRSVPDENLGPLIATDMTRCIHCTRCIRFTEEIAGFQELGMIGRGENMKVRVALEQTVQHEMSGNVIDLCPVGALVSKPYRFSARAWEMTSHALVSPHDGLGTNVFAHVLRGKLMRVVPRENEDINETWIADRDRFSYEGIYSAERLTRADGARGRGVEAGGLGNGAEESRRWAAREGFEPGRVGQRFRYHRRAVICWARSPGRWARRTSIIGCVSGMCGIRRRIRCTRHSACRSRTSRRSTRCCSSAATCAAKRRCSRIACASAARRGTKVLVHQPGEVRLPVPGGVVHRSRGGQHGRPSWLACSRCWRPEAHRFRRTSLRACRARRSPMRIGARGAARRAVTPALAAAAARL